MNSDYRKKQSRSMMKMSTPSFTMRGGDMYVVSSLKKVKTRNVMSKSRSFSEREIKDMTNKTYKFTGKKY